MISGCSPKLPLEGWGWETLSPTPLGDDGQPCPPLDPDCAPTAFQTADIRFLKSPFGPAFLPSPQPTPLLASCRSSFGIPGALAVCETLGEMPSPWHSSAGEPMVTRCGATAPGDSGG